MPPSTLPSRLLLYALTLRTTSFPMPVSPSTTRRRSESEWLLSRKPMFSSFSSIQVRAGRGYVEHPRNVSWLIYAVKYHVQDAELWCRKALYLLMHQRLGEDVHHYLGCGEYLVFKFK